MSRRQRQHATTLDAEGPGRARRLSRWFFRLALAVVVGIGMWLSAWWAARVPIFAAPDEDVHFDYVVNLVKARRIILASERPVAQIGGGDPFVPITHPDTLHLAQISETRRMRFHGEEKVPHGYGGESFFAEVNRSAPASGMSASQNPWVITEYPVAYYAIAALWASAWSSGSGPVQLFFAARSLSVLLLGVGLVAWWAMLRSSGCPPWKALGVLAAVALLPLTSFVSSYVQPDNLAFSVVPLCLWLALRAANGPPSAGRLAGAGSALGLLLITKYHVFLAVAPPVLALLAVAHARWRPRRWLAWAMLLLSPSLLATELQLWISSGGGVALRNLTSGSARLSQLAATEGWAIYFVRIVRSAVHNFFGENGDTFRTFWWLFGWLDTPVVIVSGSVQAVIVLLLQAGMIAALVLLVVRWQQVLSAIVNLWCRGARRRALRLALSDPLLMSYLLFAAAIIAIYVSTANGFLAQGRNWYPFLPAIFWATVDYSPRALRSRRAARWLGRTFLGGLLLYAALGAYYARVAIEDRYYGGQEIAAIFHGLAG